MDSRRKQWVWMMSLLCCLVLIGLFGRTEAAEKPLVVVQHVDVTSFDPTSRTYGPNRSFYANLYDALTVWDEKEPTKLVPMLATSWKLINDKTWQFKLRKGVAFTNGEPFNAQTVKANIEWLITPGKHTVAGSYNTIERAEIVDDYTINVITTKPDPLLPKRFAAYGGQMTPPEYIKKVGREGLGSKPVGTGPYMLKEWVKDDHVTLVRNEKYWGKKADFQEVIIKPVPDGSTRLNMLLTGEADLITSVLPDQVGRVKESKVSHIETGLGAMNYEYVINARKGPLSDRKVRQACNYALNKEQILNQLWKGYGVVINGCLTTFDFGYDPKTKPYPYDPAKARDLIKEAGYKPGQITFDVMSLSSEKELTEIVCAQLNEAGINAKPRIIEGAERAKIIKDASIWEDTGGALLILAGSTLYDAEGILWRTRHPDGLYGNYWEGSEPGKSWGLFEMMEEARYSFDQKKREKIYFKANQIARDEAISLFLFQYTFIQGVSNRVNYKIDQGGLIYFNRIYKKK